MDGGLQILGKMCDELERKREKNREAHHKVVSATGRCERSTVVRTEI